MLAPRFAGSLVDIAEVSVCLFCAGLSSDGREMWILAHRSEDIWAKWALRWNLEVKYRGES